MHFSSLSKVKNKVTYRTASSSRSQKCADRTSMQVCQSTKKFEKFKSQLAVLDVMIEKQFRHILNISHLPIIVVANGPVVSNLHFIM